MHIGNKLIILSLSSALLFTSSFSKEIQIEQELKQDAKKAIKTVAGALQTALMQKIKEGGFTNASTFCSTNATSLAKGASKSLKEGIKLKRITDKPRNEMSQASAEDLVVFEEIKTKIANNQEVGMIVKQKSDNHYQVYKAIKIQKPCLNCHGDEKTRNKEAYEIISKKYPNDKAINYKLGDFRGVFLVDIVK